MIEVVRLLTVFVCFANIGAVAGLFSRVGKYIIPKASVRALMLGNACVVLTIGLANLTHIHKPITWAAYMVLAGVTLKLGAIMSLWQWYGTPEGHAHTERMVGSVAKAKKDSLRVEKRLRRLALGMLGLYGIALATILLIGYFQQSTNAALCTFRGDLQGRADNARGILTLPENRGKAVVRVPQTNIRLPRSVLQNQINGQDKTLRSLDALRC